MNTFFCSMFAFLSLASCTGADAIKGNEYTLIEPKYSTEVTLGFDKKQDLYHGAVLNRYFGNYAINKKGVIEFKNSASTKMAGSPEDMKSEDEYFKGFGGTMNFKTEDDNLILTNKDGKQFIYKKTQNAEK